MCGDYGKFGAGADVLYSKTAFCGAQEFAEYPSQGFKTSGSGLLMSSA